MAANVITFAVDTTAAGSVFGWKCPDDAYGGGVTIHDVTFIGSGTVTGALFTYTDAGTPAVSGTIVASAAATIAAGVPLAKTVADGWVDGGEWVVWAHSAGTALALSRIVFQYTDGL
jgi:hypothetical protein